MFMPLIVGILSSHEHIIWRMALLLVCGMMIGAALTAFAVHIKSLPVLLLGRLLTGCVSVKCWQECMPSLCLCGVTMQDELRVLLR